MELWQLRYFVRVAETGSIAQASVHLRIAAPAISRSIKGLEDELSTRLFERDGRGMHLTQAGTLLLTRATGLLRDAELTRQEVSATGAQLQGQVTIGATPSFIAIVGLDFMRRCADRYKLVQPQILEGYSLYLEDWVRTGAVDLAVVNGMTTAEGRISAESLGAERLFAIGRAGHWDGKLVANAVPLRTVLAEPLLLPSSLNRIRSVLDRAAAEQGLEVKTLYEVDSIRLLRDLMLDGMAAAVLPYGAAMREIESGQLHGVPICDPAVLSEIHLLHPMDLPPGPVARAAIGLLREALAHFGATSTVPVLCQRDAKGPSHNSGLSKR